MLKVHAFRVLVFTLLNIICDRVLWSRARQIKSLYVLHQVRELLRGHFTHETEGPKPLHSKISHRSKMPRPPRSLHTRRWRPKGPKKLSWMKTLHGKLWVMFCGHVPKDRHDANSANHVLLNNRMAFRQESQSHGHNPCFVGEVALRGVLHHGPWSRPMTTSVYTKERMSDWPWSSRPPKGIF